MMVGVFGWLQHQFTWFRDVYDKTTDLPKMAFSSSLQDSFAVAILQNNCLRPLKYDPDFVYLLENLTCAHSPCDVLCKNNHRIFCQREEFQSILDKPSNFRKNNLNCYGTYIITCMLKVLEVTIWFVLNVQEFWTFSAKIDLLV